jgi:hypothetical protein
MGAPTPAPSIASISRPAGQVRSDGDAQAVRGVDRSQGAAEGEPVRATDRPDADEVDRVTDRLACP